MALLSEYAGKYSALKGGRSRGPECGDPSGERTFLCYGVRSSHKSRATGLRNPQGDGRRLASCGRQPTGHGIRRRQGGNASMSRPAYLNKKDHYHEPSTSGISGSASVNTAEQPKKKLALQHSLRHHPLTLKGIVKVIPVLQPNRRQRFDIWVKNEVAAGL
ncbi:hypothetical protein PSTG_07250 [Puccinia striiformis f. sp. tritici PST-78]|uniref:Uncharacterized protein n=1 Tax=Puccinia striiformis f. sp. tritici PST-78 TaxID=1165861 RepID=A0A0L0VK00_9BASI|nr:hypothetical protein PSTG_07250 [Puccinia striiformis f. sp. tritici PST-78]